jgi:hypothetical protein
MKTLVYLFVIAMLLFAGCAKDDMFTDNMNNPELKKAKVPIPMKIEYCGTSDWSLGAISYGDPNTALPIKMIVSGKATHMGKFNSEKSYWLAEVYEPRVDSEGITYLFQSGTGYLVGANGDYINYAWEVNAALPDLDFTGKLTLQDGTGNFEGCSGTINVAGTVVVIADVDVNVPPTVTICCSGEGLMEFD